MTNELPVVGKRYKFKHYETLYPEVEVLAITNSYAVYLGKDKHGFEAVGHYGKLDFLQNYEELPEDKAETQLLKNTIQENLQRFEEEKSSLPVWAVALINQLQNEIKARTQSDILLDPHFDARHGIKEGDIWIDKYKAENKILIISSSRRGITYLVVKGADKGRFYQQERLKFVECFEFYEKGDLLDALYNFKKETKLNPEVKEAMEFLRLETNLFEKVGEVLDKRLINILKLHHKHLAIASKNLLNALDKQFMSKEEDKIDTSSEVCLSNNEMKPNENGSFKHLDNAEEISQDIMKEESHLLNHMYEKIHNQNFSAELVFYLGQLISDFIKIKERVRKLEGK